MAAGRSSLSMTRDFDSWYLKNFEHIAYLGSGSFGCVFKARNKHDKCSYAIKRIHVPFGTADENKREMREIQALAKLNYSGIVRYYGSWTEQPPAVWQEVTDQRLGIPRNTDDLAFGSSCSFTIGQIPSTARDTTDDTRATLRTVSDSDQSNGSMSNDSYVQFRQSDNESHTDHSLTGVRIRDENGSNDVSHSSSILKYVGRLFNSSFGNSSKSNGSTSRDPNVQFRRNGKVEYLYFQMELCQETTLQAWLEKRNNEATVQPDKTQLLNIFKQLVDAIEYVHREGYIHRDIKVCSLKTCSNKGLY